MKQQMDPQKKIDRGERRVYVGESWALIESVKS